MGRTDPPVTASSTFASDDGISGSRADPISEWRGGPGVSNYSAIAAFSCDTQDQEHSEQAPGHEQLGGGLCYMISEKPMQGEVNSVGPGARNESGEIVALDVKAGDRILFGKWSGTEVKLDGEELLIMKESDIMGIIEAQSAGTLPAGKRRSAGLR